MKKTALLSVSDKTGIIELAQVLVDQGIALLSTGGTYEAIKAAGIPVETVDAYTGFPEMMDGRVKTLHPKVHGGILALRDNSEHQAAVQAHDIRWIDYVIVNLYPFKETISQKDVSLETAIENIDIGGPTMLRSAAKNYRFVTVVTDPRDYGRLEAELKAEGETSPEFRAYLAKKVFELTSHYDTLIADYLSQAAVQANEADQAWEHITLTYNQKETLRYGENGHQAASFYKAVNLPAFSIAAAEQHHGKQLSYNNLKDANAALQIAGEFDEPVAVAVKHMNPCGVGLGETIEEAFDRCYQADSISIFGGIVVVNRPVTAALAETLAGIFLEIIIAPSFEEAAMERLTKKKNLRLLTVDFNKRQEQPKEEFVSIPGGLLVQDTDRSEELPQEAITALPDAWEVATERAPEASEVKAMNFAMKIVKHVKSNAIVVANEYMTLGVGAGQMNRVGSAEIALDQAAEKDASLRETFVMASDAFFPMDDTVTLAHERGVTAVIQPGGSIRDEDSVKVCNDKGMAMVMTNVRHFRH